MSAAIPDLHVLVRFGKGIPAHTWGPALLAFEAEVRRASGVRAEVFCEVKGDDSKLRAAMTTEQRARL